MVLPATGEYIISGGLSTLHIDIDEDRGTYTDLGVGSGTGNHRAPGSGAELPGTE
jgi:hypothetical protein